MGRHYVNPALMGPGNDPAQPEILLYLPRPDGSCSSSRSNTSRPMRTRTCDRRRPAVIFGQPFDGPMPGHNPQMPIHYDLHVWLAEYNPSGLFAQWNPAIRCPS